MVGEGPVEEEEGEKVEGGEGEDVEEYRRHQGEAQEAKENTAALNCSPTLSPGAFWMCITTRSISGRCGGRRGRRCQRRRSRRWKRRRPRRWEGAGDVKEKEGGEVEEEGGEVEKEEGEVEEEEGGEMEEGGDVEEENLVCALPPPLQDPSPPHLLPLLWGRKRGGTYSLFLFPLPPPLTTTFLPLPPLPPPPPPTPLPLPPPLSFHIYAGRAFLVARTTLPPIEAREGGEGGRGERAAGEWGGRGGLEGRNVKGGGEEWEGGRELTFFLFWSALLPLEEQEDQRGVWEEIVHVSRCCVCMF